MNTNEPLPTEFDTLGTKLKTTYRLKIVANWQPIRVELHRQLTNSAISNRGQKGINGRLARNS